MFTGLVEGMGRVRRLTRGPQGAELVVESELDLGDLKPGDSIAVNGACLTVVEVSPGGFRAQLSPETLSRTTFARLGPGDAVNLERPLRPADRLGGHLVTGHVDCVGTVVQRREQGQGLVLRVRVPQDFSRWLVDKGSVALDGVSMTVVEPRGGEFSVHVIPHTAATTTLGRKRVGEGVNVEFDLLGKYVERLLRAERSGLDLEFLREHGFL